MKLPDDKRGGNPADRFRTILTADKEEELDPDEEEVHQEGESRHPGYRVDEGS